MGVDKVWYNWFRGLPHSLARSLGECSITIIPGVYPIRWLAVWHAEVQEKAGKGTSKWQRINRKIQGHLRQRQPHVHMGRVEGRLVIQSHDKIQQKLRTPSLDGTEGKETLATWLRLVDGSPSRRTVHISDTFGPRSERCHPWVWNTSGDAQGRTCQTLSQDIRNPCFFPS